MGEMTISGPHSLSIRKKKNWSEKEGFVKITSEERIKMRNYITLVSEEEE